MFLFLYVWIHAHKRIYKRNFKVVWLLENTIFVLMLLPTHFSIFVPVLTNQTYWSKSIKFALLLLKSHFGITYQTIYSLTTPYPSCAIFLLPFRLYYLFISLYYHCWVIWSCPTNPLLQRMGYLVLREWWSPWCQLTDPCILLLPHVFNRLMI
jgi:hypothetical protein